MKKKQTTENFVLFLHHIETFLVTLALTQTEKNGVDFHAHSPNQRRKKTLTNAQHTVENV